MALDRVKTGIPDFDKLIEGGIPKGNMVLVAGACGTGKSIFGAQYLYNGAKFFNEPGVFVTLEQKPQDVIDVMENFGWEASSLIKNKKLLVTKPGKDSLAAIEECIFASVNEIGAKRLVIDSITLLGMYFKDEFELRTGLKQLHWKIKATNCTTLAISDTKEKSATYSISGCEEFIADGVIVLRIMAKEIGGGAHTRGVFVRKMRGTMHSLDVFPMKVDKKGIEIFPNIKIFEQEYAP